MVTVLAHERVAVRDRLAAFDADPRCYAPVGVAERLRAVATPVPQPDGAFLREGRSSRRATRFWAFTLRLVDSPIHGLFAERRIWSGAGHRDRFLASVGRLTGVDPERLGERSDEDVQALLEATLARHSYVVTVETGTDGRLDVAFVDDHLGRVSVLHLPEPPTLGHCPPPTPPAVPLLDAEFPYRYITAPEGVRRLCESLAAARVIALDIETHQPGIGEGEDWEPSDGAIRLIQVAAEVNGALICGVVDCYAVNPEQLVRLVTDPGRVVVAHNGRYESDWLRFHYGTPPLTQLFDTMVCFRVFEHHWAAADAAYERRPASLGAVLPRIVGVAKTGYQASDWSVELTAQQRRYAATDAAALLVIARTAVRLAGAFGCEAQIAAATATLLREHDDRVAAQHPHDAEAVGAAITAATSTDQLAAAAALARRSSLGSPTRHELRRLYRTRAAALRDDARAAAADAAAQSPEVAACSAHTDSIVSASAACLSGRKRRTRANRSVTPPG